uniref:chorismate transformation enzyme, FkbO/Hyg5 family n=1 Tax=Alistipes sp. TaxID=1872444 RepID=UPI0040566134
MDLKIYSSTFGIDDFQNIIRRTLENIPIDSICGLVFCGTSDTMEYHQLLNEIKSVVYGSLGKRVPITLIPQYLLPKGGLALEVYTLEGVTDIHIEERNGVCYGIIENEQEKMLFVEGIPASDFSKSVKQQSQEVFTKLDNLLSAYGYGADDIVRQWNFIGSIVSYRNGKQNYQEFNDARTCYYATGEWKNGYPAATGIGAEGDCIIVGGIAFKKIGADTKGIYPIDNPLQVAAHIYSKRVLIDDDVNAMKSTPKFERAKLIETACGACCFVSGTAAIRGEESVDASSVKMQTIKTIENIEYLVSKENLVRFGCKPYDLEYVKLHVYIKNAEDYDVVREVVEASFAQIPVVYSIADVCRSELLVEIEGILKS